MAAGEKHRDVPLSQLSPASPLATVGSGGSCERDPPRRGLWGDARVLDRTGGAFRACQLSLTGLLWLCPEAEPSERQTGFMGQIRLC